LLYAVSSFLVFIILSSPSLLPFALIHSMLTTNQVIYYKNFTHCSSSFLSCNP
jgi:hypothetical protein